MRRKKVISISIPNELIDKLKEDNPKNFSLKVEELIKKGLELER